MSEAITGLQTPYEYVLLGFVIHSHNHTKSIDVKNNVIMFEIYESIHLPYLTANFILHDDITFVDGVKPNGTELVEITVGQPSVDSPPITLDFVFSSITATEKSSDNVEIVKASLIEQCAFNNTLKQFSRSYQGKPSKIIQKICDNQLGLDVELPEVEESQKAIKYIVPFDSAFGACSRVLQKMSTINGLPYFLFRTINDEKLQLKSLEEILELPAWNPMPYSFSRANKNNGQKALTAPNIYNVEKFDGGTLKSGIADLLLDGMMGSEATVIDAGSGAKEFFKHNLESTFDMLKSIGVIDNDYEGSVGTGKYLFNEVPIEEMPNRTFHGIISNNTYNKYPNIHQEMFASSVKLGVTKRAVGHLLSRSMVKMQVPGVPYLFDGTNRSVGTNIDFLITSNILDPSEIEGAIDKQRSGKYMISAARHIFDDNNEHRVNLEINKLGTLK